MTKEKATKTPMEGWTVEGKTATYNDGTLEETYCFGRKVDEQWSYRVTVTLSESGLTVRIEDDNDRSGMAHGGSTTNFTIPLTILSQLLMASDEGTP